MQKDIVLLGIQGCGKGTQANLLRKILPDHLYYEMGQTLRALGSNDNLIGNHIRETVNSGLMVDNYVTHYLILTSLHIAKNTSKFVLIDGFPRVMEQAEFFIQKEEKLERDFVIIQYVLSEEKAMERLYQRAKVSPRSDDNEEAIRKRFAIFADETSQVLKLFEEMGKLVKIDADQSIEKIFEDTKKALAL